MSKTILRVYKKHTTVHANESEIENEQSIDAQNKKAEINKKNAETGDIEAQTNLKVRLSYFIAALIVVILFFQFHIACKYLTHLIEMKKEIPKEVIISIFAASAAVTTLMGFILKGLFNSK